MTILLRLIRIISFIVVIVPLAVFILHVQPGQALVVDVQIEPEDGFSLADQQEMARKIAFSKALLAEAGALLPAGISEERAQLLQRFLMNRADTLVLSYSRLSSSINDGALDARFDVSVSKSMLHSVLSRMGLLAPNNRPHSVVITARGDAMEHAKELSELRNLYGLTTDMNSELELVVSRGQDSQWQAVLVENDISVSTSASDSLESAWFSVWGPYFGHIDQAEGTRNGTLLHVKGWFAPSGPSQFSLTLDQWEKAVNSAEIISLELFPEGVGGTWTVKTRDEQLLKTLLEEYVNGRGLTFELSSLSPE